MKIRILGSAAGGGFPQWNCNCRNCRGVRSGTLRATARTQSSIAVSGVIDDAWALINASPDILQQLQANPELQPARSIRDTGINAIVLTDAQIDHTVGLFMLREAIRPWQIWCTDNAYRDITSGNPIFDVLKHYCGVDRRRIELHKEPFGIDAIAALTFHAISLQSKPPPFSPNREAPQPGDNIALCVTDVSSDTNLFYAPGLGALDEQTWQHMYAADCVLVDGTFWTDDEMIRLGLSKRTARAIGHLPQSGPDGMIEWLDRLPATTRKILIHINNTNPILDEDSPERAVLIEHGIEIAYDGMEIEL
ncbi:MAG: pyrroloquinoline quinone biosynthesis protein PqqB [Candidatus Obscuribacterales bacterium]|nr:pyrroloquinoline quinone biosynthesis protein PqqB [Steroidobacteraceae bacterium]